MKLATLACLAALCLTGPSAHAAPGEQPKAEKAPQPARTEPAARSEKGEQPKAEQPKAEQSRTEPGRTEPGKAAQPAAAGARERRRRSYAACNRASHLRDYRGGRRRRFLIRCRLGYERTRTPGVQQAPAAPPAAVPQPGRKP